MPPKVNPCPVLLPNTGNNPCMAFGHMLFGMSAPALASHALVVTIGLSAYLWNQGDTRYAGLAAPYVDMIPTKMLPADWQFYLTNALLIGSMLCLFQTPLTGFCAKTFGLCMSSIQICAAVMLPCVASFYLKPFEGYALLCFGIGYATATAFNIKKRALKWASILGATAVVKLGAVTASAAGTISNFHHMVFVSAYLMGAVSMASMGPPHGGKGMAKPKARGRSASVSKKK